MLEGKDAGDIIAEHEMHAGGALKQVSVKRARICTESEYRSSHMSYYTGYGEAIPAVRDLFF